MKVIMNKIGGNSTMKKRLLASLLSLAMVLTMLPSAALATDIEDDGLCSHHTEHTAECGYAAPTEGMPCTHAHTAECYSDGLVPADGEEKAADTCTHTQHDETCGYSEGSEGSPCTFDCSICPVEAMIEALPAYENVTQEDVEDIEAAQAAYDALGKEQAAVDSALVEKLEALTQWAEIITATSDSVDPLTDPVPVETGNLDLTNGSIVITATGYTQGDATSETPYVGNYTITQTDSTTATQNTITVKSGTPTITLSGVNIEADSDGTTQEALCAFAIEGGGVTLMLAEGTTNTLQSEIGQLDNTAIISFAGIWVNQGASLTIDGSGTLDVEAAATNWDEYKDVSSDYTKYFGNVGLGSGIGACGVFTGSSVNTNYRQYSTVGDITIKGGTVNAISKGGNSYSGAGIGGGTNHSNITISGGTVTAKSSTSANSSAGIGGVYGYNGRKTITISDGKVTAEGGTGIGGGAYQNAHTIIISDGEVSATGNGGAGIGGGGGNFIGASSVGGSITIVGGKVIAQGGTYAAGIGGGGAPSPGSTFGGGASNNITISGGEVTAKGGQYGPGIGSGSAKNRGGATENGLMETITITGGTITAINGEGYTVNGLTLNSYDTGIGQGMNPHTTVDYDVWAVQTAAGDAIALRAVIKDTDTLTRNGVSDFKPAQLVINETTYYLLPEGYYDEFADDKLVSKTDVTGGSAVATLISNLNSLTAESDDFAKNLIQYEEDYNDLSETLQYYVDETVKEGHTVAELMKSLEGSHQVQVTLQHGHDENQDREITVTYHGDAIDFGVPTRDNYKFLGWYLGEIKVTNADGVCEQWIYSIAAVTLTARWSSAIEGEGTASSPYILTSAANLVVLSRISNGVATEDELALFGENATEDSVLAAHYQLSDDWANQTLSTADGFYGITGFQGTFDGNNKTINLAIDTSNVAHNPDENKYPSVVENRGRVNVGTEDDPTYVEVTGGLFNTFGNNGATVKDLTTTGSVKLLVYGSFSGVIVGTARNATFENCINNASFEMGATDNTTWAGGIAGYATGDTATFKNCVNTGNITAGKFDMSPGNSCAAGICAYSNAPEIILTSCSNRGDLTATRQYENVSRTSSAVGLIYSIAGVDLTMEDCSNTGNLRAEASSGNTAVGLCITTGSKLTMEGCTNSGTVYARDGYASLLAGAPGGVTDLPADATYTDCAHLMTGEGNTSYTVDGVAATDNSDGTVTLGVPVTSNEDNYYDGERFVSSNGAKVADIISADNHNVYNDFSVDSNVAEDTVPFQSWEDAYTIRTASDYINLVKAIQGNEAAQNAVLGNRLSGTTADARATALARAYVKVAGNFTLSDTSAIGLGTEGNPFSGKIDGQGYTITYAISETALNNDDACYIGVIGNSNGAEVKDLFFDGSVNITVAAGNQNNIYVGAAVAYGSGAVVDNCHSTVTYTGVRGEVSHKSATVGYLEIGGLVGRQDNITVSDSSHEGDITVTAPKYAIAGGIGAEIDGTVTNSTVKGDMTAHLTYDATLPIFAESAYAGGIAGMLRGGTVTGCTAAGIMTATNTASADANLGQYGYAYAGGLIGQSSENPTVTDSSALATVSANAQKGNTFSCAGGVAGNVAYNSTLTVSGSYSVKTDTIGEVSGATSIDTTQFSGRTFGETVNLSVPAGVTMDSDAATMTGGTVTFIQAGEDQEIELLYDGKVFYSADIDVSPKELDSDDVTIHSNDAYASEDEAAAAADSVEVVYGDLVLTQGVDYTISSSSGTFTINFTGNYTGTAIKSYTVSEDTLAGVTADSYIDDYDGLAHGITVNAPNGATVTYGTDKDNLSSTPVTRTNAGTYTVYWKAETGGKSVTGSAVISITPADLTIVVDDKEIEVGDNLPEFTYTVSGLVDGDALEKEPTLSCSASNTNTAGSYTITASGASAGDNYIVSYDNGILTISAKSPDDDPDNGSSGSSGSTRYTVSVEDTDNGEVSVSPSRASYGRTVTITVEPDEGYELDELIVTDADGDEISVRSRGDGRYTFTMPRGRVTVEATFVEIAEEPTLLTFTDVSESAYYYDAVAWAVENGVTSGTSATTFSPDASCTRAQMVTFLWRAAGSPEPESTVNPFTDVSASAYYYDAVLWAVEQGITNGTSATTFGPDATVTRGQTVTFLWRYDGSTAVSGSGFADVASDAYYADAVAWAASEGITSGTSATTFSPDNDCTRAQIVTFLYRYMA